MARSLNWTRAHRRDLSERARRMDADARMGTSIARVAERRGAPPTAAQLHHISRLRARLGLDPAAAPPLTRHGASACIANLNVRVATAPPLVAAARPPAEPRPADDHALAVRCTRCNATADQPCQDRSGRHRPPHAARLRAAGPQ